MKSLLVLLAFVGYAHSIQYVWDILKLPLDASEVASILQSGSYPQLRAIPDDAANYDCSKKPPGFYADVSQQCQLFHRCDVNGNHTAYLCVNSTVFNQITLVCDYFFNVDCDKFAQYENFANSRLYKDGAVLFDSPPTEYLAPSQKAAVSAQGRSLESGGNGNQVQPSAPNKVGGKPLKPVKVTTTTTTAASSSEAGSSEAAPAEDTTSAAGSSSEAPAADSSSQASSSEAPADSSSSAASSDQGSSSEASADNSSSAASADQGASSDAPSDNSSSAASADQGSSSEAPADNSSSAASSDDSADSGSSAAPSVESTTAASE
jgi:hypothetical protein